MDSRQMAERVSARNPTPQDVPLPHGLMNEAQLLSEVRRRTALPRRRLLRPEPPSLRRGLTLAAGSAVLLLVLVALPLVLFLPMAGDESPSATAAPSTIPSSNAAPTSVAPATTVPTSTQAPSPTTLQPASTLSANLTWTVSPMVGLEAPPAAVAQISEGFVALANDCATVVTSPDLVTWEERSALGEAVTSPCSIAASSEGALVVIINTADGVPRAWTSADGGTWEEATGGFIAGDVVVDVTAAPPGFVAVGSHDDQGARAWASADGRAWTTVFQHEGAEVKKSFLTVASHGGLVVAGGNQREDVAQDSLTWTPTPFIWTSADAARWSEAALATDCGSGSIYYMASGPIGLVAGGICTIEGDTVTVSAVYHSDDGITWTAVADNGLEDLALVTGISAGNAGYAFTGVFRPPVGAQHEGDTTAIWTSGDGLAWSHYALGNGDEATLALVDAAGVTVAGSRAGAPVVWRATPAD